MAACTVPMPSISGQFSGGEYAVSLARLRLATKRVTSGTWSTPGAGTSVSVAVRSWVGVSASGVQRQLATPFDGRGLHLVDRPVPALAARRTSTVAPSTGPHSSRDEHLDLDRLAGKDVLAAPGEREDARDPGEGLDRVVDRLARRQRVAAAAVVGDPLRGAELGAEADHLRRGLAERIAEARLDDLGPRRAVELPLARRDPGGVGHDRRRVARDAPPGAATLPAPACVDDLEVDDGARHRRSTVDDADLQRPVERHEVVAWSSGTGGMTSCPSPPT